MNKKLNLNMTYDEALEILQAYVACSCRGVGCEDCPFDPEECTQEEDEDMWTDEKVVYAMDIISKGRK